MRICEKYALTVAEGAAYFGIGEKKLRSMLVGDCDFVLHVGTKSLIKRQMLEAFLNGACAI